MADLLADVDHHFVHTGYMHGLRTYECTICGAFAADVEIGGQS